MTEVDTAKIRHLYRPDGVVCAGVIRSDVHALPDEMAEMRDRD